MFGAVLSAWLSPCEHDGICINTPGSFHCDCASGFSGDRCEVNINECASNPCQNDGTCLDERGRFTCVCMDGSYFTFSLSVFYTIRLYCTESGFPFSKH